MEKITKELIQKYLSENEIPLNCTHQNLCVPIIDRIYRKMLVGIKFAAIKVENDLICDGHHRYLAALLAKYAIGTTPFVTTSATTVINWESVRFEDDDCDTPVKIRMLNERDAGYNNIPIEKPVGLVRLSVILYQCYYS